MSNKIQIITDSTAYFTKEDALNKGIEVIPLSYTFEENNVEEGFPGEFQVFFEKLAKSKQFPTTSQPSISSFKSKFQEILKQDKEIIVIVLSSELSGTYSSAFTAAQQTKPEMISVIDSQTTVSNLRILVDTANTMAHNGESRKDIVKEINRQKQNMGIRLTVDTLEYLRRGGRLTNIQAFLGSIMNIKPIIGLIDGRLEAVRKVRGKNKAIESMLSDIPENVQYIFINHVMAYEDANALKNIIKQKFKNALITVDELGPVIGSHIGPKAIGVCYKW
ncbi:MAG: DegV family protein [Clostridia bacterium]|nr:DegV family protein [Clostridia bacterium]